MIHSFTLEDDAPFYNELQLNLDEHAEVLGG